MYDHEYTYHHIYMYIYIYIYIHMSSSGQPLPYTAWAPHGAMVGPSFGPAQRPISFELGQRLAAFTVAWHERLAACLYMCAHAFTITMHERLAAWYFIDTSGLPLDMFARAACRNRCCT